MLPLARAVARSLSARARSAVTTEKLAGASSRRPRARRSSYAIGSPDQRHMPAAQPFCEERVAFCSAALEFALVEDRVVVLPPKVPLQRRHGVVQLGEIHPSDDEQGDRA